MIQPEHLTFQKWFDAVSLLNPSGWSLGTVLDESKWREYAVGLVRAQPFATRTLPDPYQFTNWRQWADRVYPLLEGNY